MPKECSGTMYGCPMCAERTNVPSSPLPQVEVHEVKRRTTEIAQSTIRISRTRKTSVAQLLQHCDLLSAHISFALHRIDHQRILVSNHSDATKLWIYSDG